MNDSFEPRNVLAVDSASPVVSVALGRGGSILARRSMAMAHSSEALLRAIDEVLGEADSGLDRVDALVGLRGPGSFTGLRVGLSTLLGLHQSLGVPTTALPTLDVLALAAPAGARRVTTVVNALRGEWFVRLFEAGEAATDPEIVAADRIRELRPDVVIGHGLEALADHLADSTALLDGPELAPLALRHVAERSTDWSPAALLEPLYLRPPAAKAPR